MPQAHGGSVGSSGGTGNELLEGGSGGTSGGAGGSAGPPCPGGPASCAVHLISPTDGCRGGGRCCRRWGQITRGHGRVDVPADADPRLRRALTRGGSPCAASSQSRVRTTPQHHRRHIAKAPRRGDAAPDRIPRCRTRTGNWIVIVIVKRTGTPDAAPDRISRCPTRTVSVSVSVSTSASWRAAAIKQRGTPSPTSCVRRCTTVTTLTSTGTGTCTCTRTCTCTKGGPWRERVASRLHRPLPLGKPRCVHVGGSGQIVCGGTTAGGRGLLGAVLGSGSHRVPPGEHASPAPQPQRHHVMRRQGRHRLGVGACRCDAAGEPRQLEPHVVPDVGG